MPKKYKILVVYGLTLGRIPLIFGCFILSLYMSEGDGRGLFALAFSLLVAAALSDLFDGMLARRFGVVSRLGSHLDPLTDKIFYLTILPLLVYLAVAQGQVGHSRLLLVMTVLFLLRDQWVTFLRAIGSLHGKSGEANWSGKLRTLLAFPTICAAYWLILRPPTLLFAWLILYGAELACMAVNVVSIYVYSHFYWPSVVREFRGR